MLDFQRMRRLPVGAEPIEGGGVHFRVWAPRARRVEVLIESAPGIRDRRVLAVELAAEDRGYFAGLVAEAAAGTRYRYRLDGEGSFPDPASRSQPEGVHGPSQVVDPSTFAWTDGEWPGIGAQGQVLYEMHVGTFTREGTWEAAARELPALVDLGVTAIEMMPVAEFPGNFGWGYDGVDLFAPTRLYGSPDDLRSFVDRAHALGLGVILDVVYNHLGPDGNYLKAFAPAYFTDRYENEWGEAINFDGDDAGPVREFFVSNARYWIEEFHFDGMRLDATQQIFDESPRHVLAEISGAVRAAAGERSVLLVAENEPQDVRTIRPEERGGFGLDAVWNDDFHHSAIVALTGRNEAYYSDYLGSAQELVSAVKWGFLYQGQRYVWQQKRRGSPALGQPPAAFVNFLQNHDQVANSAFGQRIHELATPGQLRAMTTLLLLGPGTPLLFQGQEFAASSPFLYFADHEPDLARAVREGRTEFLSQFSNIATPEMRERLPDPDDPDTFRRSKLDHAERERHAQVYVLHRDLLRLRRDEEVFRAQRAGGVDGAVLTPQCLVLRFFADDGMDRLLLVNLGRDVRLEPAPEPLLAPPQGMRWRILWSSESPDYGGMGTAEPETGEGWRIPGRTAVVLAPAERPEEE